MNVVAISWAVLAVISWGFCVFSFSDPRYPTRVWPLVFAAYGVGCAVLASLIWLGLT